LVKGPGEIKVGKVGRLRNFFTRDSQRELGIRKVGKFIRGLLKVG